jgi:hypothetical protein
MKSAKKITGLVILLLALANGVFGQEAAFIEGASFGMAGGRQAHITVNAAGDEVVQYQTFARVGGVLFQATARAAGGAAGQPVSLAYDPERPDGERLAITIGGTEISPALYDWQLIPIARLAGSEYTACVSLLGRPRSLLEINTSNSEMRATGQRRTMYAEYHPDLSNTLIGLNLFFVDAMLVNPYRMRQVTDGFTGVIPGYNDIPFDKQESAAGTLLTARELMSETYQWGTYIYTDYGADMAYSLEDGRLVFSGCPSYLFAKVNAKTETATLETALNAYIRDNLQTVRAINPIVYAQAELAAQWAAFFRMIREQNPPAWEAFTARIAGITPEPFFETPRSWLKW